MPTIMVTSPGFQVSLCLRATIHERMNGAVTAARSAQSSTVNVCQALALSPGPMPAELILELGLSLVLNQGSHSDASSTSADAIPISSAGVNRDKST